MKGFVAPLHQAVRLQGDLNFPGTMKGNGKEGQKGDESNIPNPLVVLRRAACVHLKENDVTADILDPRGTEALMKWAAGALGGDEKLLTRTNARRKRALSALRGQGTHVVRLSAEVEWRLGVGLGARENVHEFGLTLHGTYGVPMIPGSSVKGMTAALAREQGADPRLMEAVFGSPRPATEASEAGGGTSSDSEPEGAASQGGVCFLDALPTRPATIVRDVLTPHVQPYYASTQSDPEEEDPSAESQPVAPGEHHNPIPVEFLTVSKTAFGIDLIGRDPALLKQAADWCATACEDLGVGGKTGAGYGYLRAGTLPPPEASQPYHS
ncbi:hypothetical protein GCM10027160_00560 [Streptomyces calidiresistens]|uniref:Type III-B CRISPR module RAMP protein Cmr6 n=1 Tax=Streptomyces calidiresistens TaxID=1485586 RepID=A0A7W3XV30_9ACTN|nr:type III-B CRISPR module RAMP protein Cmr6 [Streptomyces calidiresistens]MBB0228324.1 type III-B CRISPR module RAMP protein Cmr6 [Streptomyces calidiresistens]